ncbi:hypothetical protein ACSDR0_28690 [Streptosporangium sp. G11]|uniref:hypothetical protein n=1 Tax=Streptosporangium sp. G11 TaxID=3436926 RepID=UPI003EBB32C9
MPSSQVILDLAGIVPATAVLWLSCRFIVMRPRPVRAADLGEADDGIRASSLQTVSGAAGTAARAYRELEAAGYLRGRAGRGTVVHDIPHLPETERTTRLADAARAYAATARELGVDADVALGVARRHLTDPAG